MSTLLRTLTGIVAVASAASAQASGPATSLDGTDRMVAALHLDDQDDPSAATGAKSPFEQADLLRAEGDDGFAGVGPDKPNYKPESVAAAVGPMATSDPTAVQVNNTRDLGRIPEPGSWAMMLFGFAVAGTALRRKPRRVPQAA